MCQWLWRLLLLSLIYNLIATFWVLRSFWSGFKLELFSPGLCVAFFSFKVPIYIFRSGKAFQCIYDGVDDKYLVAKLLPSQGLSPVYSTNWSHFAALLCIDNVGIIWTRLSICGHLSQTHTTMDIILTLRAEGQFIPLMTFTSFSYVCLSFLRLRWTDEISSRVLLALTTVITIVLFLLGTYYILLSH